jgi:hypothetical protein
MGTLFQTDCQEVDFSESMQKHNELSVKILNKWVTVIFKVTFICFCQAHHHYLVTPYFNLSR